MRSLSKLTPLALFFGLEGHAANGRVAERDNVTLPVPIVAVPSEHWEGDDGTWSTFEIRLGTPATTYRVLPATSWQETWVIYGAAANVCNTSAGVAENCEDSRGGLFDSAKSSTWEDSGQFQLGLNDALGYNGVGKYGFDTVGIGYTNSTGPTLPHQIVSEIVSDTWWFGMLGLGFQPTNFSAYGDPQASFSDTLYSNGTIASMSWSYTAGAVYRLKSVFGDLIFGGYDKSRFTANDVRFTMTEDNLRDLVVTIRSITSTTSSGNKTLMSSPEFAFIDSTVPEIWLPVDVCEAFEAAFGLTLDPASDLYLLNTSLHSSLQSMNPSITFTLSDQKTSGGPTTNITLPYSAFDLNISAPALPNSTGAFYFPLRRATSDSEYTLGRTFLQEAYVTAHYNSRTFNVSQCVFSDSTNPQIIALPPTLPSTTSTASTSSTPGSGSKHHSKLSAGAIAGIVIGVLAFFIILALLIFLCLRRRKRNKEAKRPKSPVHEIDTGKRVDPIEASAYDAQASKLTTEVAGRETLEKDGWPIMQPQELEAELPAGTAVTGALATVPEHRRIAEMAGGNGNNSLSPTDDVSSEGNTRSFDDDHIVSPNTETGTMPPISATERTRRSDVVSTPSPTTSAGGWSLGRRGSRFEENL